MKQPNSLIVFVVIFSVIFVFAAFWVLCSNNIINLNPPQKDEIWVMKSSNPFTKPVEVRILDQKQGWVLYTSVQTGGEYSLSVRDFKTIYHD